MEASDVPSIITLELPSIPENLTLVRGMLGGVAELLAMDAELLDDLKTAVSEAANNVVMHAYGGEPGPLAVQLSVTSDGLEAVIRDEGVGISELAPIEDRIQGVGLPVMEALSQQADFRRKDGGGTEVRMVFPSQRNGRPLFGLPVSAAPEDGWADRLPRLDRGDACHAGRRDDAPRAASQDSRNDRLIRSFGEGPDARPAPSSVSSRYLSAGTQRLVPSR